jgi:hypothetical protein
MKGATFSRAGGGGWGEHGDEPGREWRTEDIPATHEPSGDLRGHEGASLANTELRLDEIFNF